MRMVLMEQKSFAWMTDFVNKNTKSGELIDDLFSGTFAVAKACLELPRHRHLVGFENAADDTKEITMTTVEMYGRQVKKKRSNAKRKNDNVVFCM